MASGISFSSIDKLTELNYETWKTQMKSVLVVNDLWEFVDGTQSKPDVNSAAWSKKDAKALALINLSVSQSQLCHTRKAQTSKEAWDILSKVYESTGHVRTVTLCKKFLRLQKSQSGSMMEYVNEFCNQAERLREAGMDLSEDVLSIMLLASLPAEYENFTVAMETRDVMPSLQNIKAKLYEEEEHAIQEQML